jgi:hypothetical protein
MPYVRVNVSPMGPSTYVSTVLLLEAISILLRGQRSEMARVMATFEWARLASLIMD